ncbi:MAG: hypothetical protein JNK85_13845 [Verrucomicrobiales bacterium]|nr:hypothetical protein [Verrucomicrobiales bacterium]
MKRLQVFIVALLSTVALSSSAETAARYENYSTITIPPQIDAVEFINHGVFNISTLLPFDMENTLYFTNRGEMIGGVGFQFDLSDGGSGVRKKAASFHNRGYIQAEEGFGGFGGEIEYSLIAGLVLGSYLDIDATNVVNTGIMGVGPNGVMTIDGGRVELSRGGLVAGTGLGSALGSSFTSWLDFQQLYINPAGVNENYWGVGINGIINTQDQQGGGIPLDLAGVTRPDSGFHQVVSAAGATQVTNFVRIPSPAFATSGGYTGYANTNALSETNWVVQVVYVPTNYPPEMSVEVRWGEPDNVPPVPGNLVALVELGLKDIDAITSLPITNRVYILDRHGATTNATLFTNIFSTNYSRPDVIDFALATPPAWLAGVPGNAQYSPELIANPLALSPQVTNYYAAVSINLGRSSRIINNAAINSALGVSRFLAQSDDYIFGGSGAGYLYDPTNNPARIEVNAESLDIYQSRFKSDGVLTVRAKHFTGRSPVRMDSPFFRFDLGSTNGSVVISNVVPDTIKRINGDLACWSSVFTNQLAVTAPDPNDPALQVTNTIDVRTHVLIVDTSGLGSEQIVETIDANIRSDHADYYDRARITRSLLIDSISFHNAGEISMLRPRTMSANEYPRLLYLTNEGSLVAPGGFKLGVDRTFRAEMVENPGTIEAGSVEIAAKDISNSGVIAAPSGVIALTVDNLKLEGGSLESLSDVVIRGKDVKAQGSSVQAGGVQVDNSTGRYRWFPGAIILDVSDRLTDGGVDAANEWSCHDGFQLAQLPKEGDLLGTSIRSLANRFGESIHYWASADRGPTMAGYTNNAALGRLTLEGNSLSFFTFRPWPAKGTNPPVANAIYVNFLEFVADATNVVDQLGIEPGFTIYFRDSNLPIKQINGLFDGRLVYVEDDGVAPSSAPSRIADGIRLRLQSGGAVGGTVSGDALTWADLPGGKYTVEYTEDLAAGPWLPLGEVTSGPSRYVRMPLPANLKGKAGSTFFRVVAKP